MEKKQGKLTVMAYAMVLGFSAVYLVGGIMLEKYNNKKEAHKK